MPLISVSIDAFIGTSLAVVLPTAWLIRRRGTDAPYRQLLNTLAIVHTLLVLYTLTIRHPPNIFQALGLPLTTPSDSIRKTLLVKAGLDAGASLPKPLETLLTRLSSFEFRVLYVRFGQAVLQDCEYCSTSDEYAIYAFPGPLLQYVREALVIGLLTINGSFREKWRTYSLAAVVCVAIIEGYWAMTTEIKIPRDGLGTFMLHDTLWTLRHLFFLILPLIIHNLPPSPPPNPTSKLISTHNNFKTTLIRLSSLKYTRGALMRDPQLRASASQWWDNQRVSGAWVRESPSVHKLADKLGYGYDKAVEERADGKLRTNALLTVNALKAGMSSVSVAAS